MFSVVFITRNESERLPQAVSSLRQFFSGEIIVADNNSTDDTVSIANSLGCKVFQLGDEFMVVFTTDDVERSNTFVGQDIVKDVEMYFQFGPARNKAISFANSRYVLNLDAGDRVEHMDCKVINGLLEPGCVFSYPHYLTVTGGHCQTAVRFFDREHWFYKGSVHEYVEQRNTQCKRHDLGANVLTVRNHKQSNSARRHNYLLGLLKDAQTQPSTRWFHYLGRELYYNEHWHAAIKVLEMGVILPGGWNTEKCQSMCYVGECWQRLCHTSKAVSAYMRALEFDATRREPWIRLATIYKSKGNVPAVLAFTTACEIFPKRVGLYENDHNFNTIPTALKKWCRTHM